MIRLWLRALPAILWMAAIYILSARTGDELGSWLPFFQEWFPGMMSFDWGHFAAYFILAWTYLLIFGIHGDRITVKVCVVLLCLLYGITDEWHQSFVPGRSPDWHDLRNDTIGAALAMLASMVPAIRRIYRKFALRMD